MAESAENNGYWSATMNVRWLMRFATTVVSFAIMCCTGETETGNAAMQNGFSWVIDHKLAGMPRPGISVPLTDDLAFLEQQGIDLLVSLTVSPLDSLLLAQHEIASLHLPVEDFHPPTLEQLHEFVDRTRTVLGDGGRVGVHCTAGIGRSGTFLATYLVYLGDTAEDAIARVRELRPGSVETAAQEEVIHEYFRSLRDN